MKINPKNIKVFCEDSDRFVDGIYASIVANNRLEFLPELYEIFGEKRLFKFIQVFEGQTFTVPKMEDFEKMLINIEIWSELEKDDSDETYDILMNRFILKKDEIHSIYSAMSAKMKYLKMRLP